MSIDKVFLSNKILLICYYDPDGLSTIKENIDMLVAHSCFDMEILNVRSGASGFLTIPSGIDLTCYMGIFIHSTVCYFPQNFDYIDSELPLKLADYPGIKILMKQDEHVQSFDTARILGHKKFDLVLTCLPLNEVPKVYPGELTGKMHYMKILTGYISENLLSYPYKPWSDRPWDITYRGSVQPLIAGELGFEKRQIGYLVEEAAKPYKLKTNISSRAEDRIHGVEWLAFLSHSKAVLGVESGSNLFDFDGKVQKICQQFTEKNPDLSVDSEKFYTKAQALFLNQYENNVYYAQISPRHFEAAATRTLQILFEGEYSQIFKPYRHYVPLKKDLSNFQEIAALLGDEKKCDEMMEDAYQEIVLNPEYHYDGFVKRLDEKIKRIFDEKKCKGLN